MFRRLASRLNQQGFKRTLLLKSFNKFFNCHRLYSRSKILHWSRWVLHSGGWVVPPYPLLIWSFQYPFSWCRLNAHPILKCSCCIYLFNWHLHLVRYLKHYIFFNRVFSTHLLCHRVAPPKMLYQYFGILHISGILLMNSYNIWIMWVKTICSLFLWIKPSG